MRGAPVISLHPEETFPSPFETFPLRGNPQGEGKVVSKDGGKYGGKP